ncbi:unnamed protein product [Discula destructiva]
MADSETSSRITKITDPAISPIVILLTGVTGFLGKVVLEERIRRRNDGSIRYDRLIVLIRASRGKSPTERFHDKVVKSQCFSELPQKWHGGVEVVSGDLMEACCGLEPGILNALTESITHILHCAGCVDFESPFNVLLAENVTGSVNILELARKSPHLRQLILTSTAYVSPHTNEPIWEQLAVLPRPAQQILDDLQEGRKSPEEIISETRHPNQYTLAKCLAEHVVAQKMGDTPVTIIRPSIISASMQYPFPGWIDSFAALAGPIAAFALGGLKVLHGDPAAILDVVPVDNVANCIIDGALFRPLHGSIDLKYLNHVPRVVHCVSTRQHGPSTWDIAFETLAYYSKPQNMVLYKPHGCYIGTDDRWFYFYEFFHQYLPLKLAEIFALMMLDWKKAARTKKTMKRLGQVDTHFRYFIQHTYDYRSAIPVLSQSFNKREYLRIVLQGVRKYLLAPMLAREKARTEKLGLVAPKKELEDAIGVMDKLLEQRTGCES